MSKKSAKNRVIKEVDDERHAHGIDGLVDVLADAVVKEILREFPGLEIGELILESAE